MPHSGHIHQPFFPGWWVVSVRGYCLRVTIGDVMALPKMAEDDRNPVRCWTPAAGGISPSRNRDRRLRWHHTCGCG